MLQLAIIEKEFTKNAMGYSALGIILSTCIGSVAAMGALSLGYGHLPMTLVTLSLLSCSAFNASILTVQKPTMVFKLLVGSVILNLLIVAITFLIA